MKEKCVTHDDGERRPDERERLLLGEVLPRLPDPVTRVRLEGSLGVQLTLVLLGGQRQFDLLLYKHIYIYTYRDTQT